MPRISLVRLKIFSMALLLAWSATANAGRDANAIELGVFPYISTRALLDLYEPMRAHLQAEMKQPVFLYTAPSYQTYVAQTRQAAYDVLVTPPHLARLAQRETGYQPLVMFTRELRGIVVVPVNSPIKTLPDLRGKRIVSPNSIALVTIMGSQLLREQGVLEGGTKVNDVGSHSNAVLAVQRGEAEAAITEYSALRQMPEYLRSSVRVIVQTRRLPHVMILVHPRLGQANTEHLRRALLHFPTLPDGDNFLKVSGFEGLRAVEEADFKVVDPILRDLKRLLETLPH